jgi:hypothetical protein
MDPLRRKGISAFSLLFLLQALFVSTFAAEIPVLLRLTANEQKDTTGCNFVYELCGLMHDEIMNGKLELWDSPSKDLKITPASLKAISNSSGIALNSRDNQMIYLYEFWNDERGELKSRTQGFLFTSKDANGKEISYGYVDFSSAEASCMRYRVKANVNGDYNSTAASYLASKNFNFNIIQFNGKVISGIKESEEILSAYVKGRNFNAQQGNVTDVKLKLVEYTLEPDPATAEGLAAKNIINVLDSFLHANIEILYNHGNDSLLNVMQGKKWKISRVDVREIWRRDNNAVNSSLVGMTLYINNGKIAEWPFRLLSTLELDFGGLSLMNRLAIKDFAHRILKINEEEISRGDAMLYRKALNETAWNRLSDYVKYY